MSGRRLDVTIFGFECEYKLNVIGETKAGTFWVRPSPNVLMFTDHDGKEYRMEKNGDFGNRKAAKYVQYVIGKRIRGPNFGASESLKATPNEVFLLFKSGFEHYIITGERDLLVHPFVRECIETGIAMWENGDELSEAVMSRETGLE